MTLENYQNALNQAEKLSYSENNSTSYDRLNALSENLMMGTVDYERELAQMNMQNAFNAWQSNLAWERQKENAQSQYQWAVQDLKKAGLNPYLAYSNGGNQVGSVPTASNSGMASQNKGKQTANLIGGILSTLLGSAFKVATTSMISESQANNMLLQNAQRNKELEAKLKMSKDRNDNFLKVEDFKLNNNSKSYWHKKELLDLLDKIYRDRR